MAFNNVGTDGVFTTGAIDISSGSVTVSLKVRSGNGLNAGQDFLRLYKKVDGGAEVQIGAANGPQASSTWTANIASGSSLVLVIRAHVTATDEYYYFDDLSVIPLTAPVIPIVTVVAGDASAGEPSNNGAFSFTRTGNISGALTVNFKLGGAATNGMDYSSIGTSVTIPAGQTSITQAVTVIDNPDVEISGTVVLTLASNLNYSSVTSNSATVNITDDDVGLPSPWLSADIGLVGATGSATYSSGTFTIKGSGADIWSKADQFRYTYQTASGDCEITARVTSLQNTDPWAKAGVMIRETTAANAQLVMLIISPTSGVAFQYRATTGGLSASYPVEKGQTTPKWLRLTRTGITFTAFRSDDGDNWTQVGTAQIVNMASTATLGLAVTSHASNCSIRPRLDGQDIK